jgi:hypothetical protein
MIAPRNPSSCVIGIDPGLNGALAVVSASGDIEVLDMPTIMIRGKRRIEPVAIIDWLVECGEVGIVALEMQSSFNQGRTSAFTAGEGFGLLRGILTTLERRYATVEPSVWTKALGVGKDKGLHRATAMRLYPQHSSLFDLARDDGRADAVLIGEYALRNLSMVRAS